jgi:hypothetical protein
MAHACWYQPHIPQTTLLARKHQKPIIRRNFRCEPVSHAAMTVIIIAGHCRKSSQSIRSEAQKRRRSGSTPSALRLVFGLRCELAGLSARLISALRR